MLGKFLQWFDETRLWHWLAKNVISKITFRVVGYTKFDYQYLDQIMAIMEKARTDRDHVYTFCLTDKMSLASILIRWVSKSKWGHAGLLINNMALHMRSKGMLLQDIPSLLRECDDFGIYKYKISDPVLVEARVRLYKDSQERVRYDFEQELEEQALPSEREDLYCSELIYMVIKDISDAKLSTVVGRKVFSPDDVARQGEKLFEYIS